MARGRRHQIRTSHARMLMGLALALGVLAAVWAVNSAADGMVVSEMSNGKTRPCDADVAIRNATVEGGCQLAESEGTIGFTFLTVLGDERLGACPIAFRVHLGSDGEIGMGEIDIRDDGSSQSVACGDVLACRKRVAHAEPGDPRLPWPGRLVRERPAGVYGAEIDMCFDTCLGRFEGTARLDVEQRPARGWRLIARSAPVGVSGLEIDGNWPLRPWTDGSKLQIEHAG